MKKDIRSRVRACHTCALSKPAQNSHWDGWLLTSPKGPCIKSSLIMWVNFLEVKPAIPLYSSVLMPFPTLCGWFRLGKRRLERRLKPSRRTYLVGFCTGSVNVGQCPVFHFLGIPAILLRPED